VKDLELVLAPMMALLTAVVVYFFSR
jgi:hypothetical protein